MMRDHIVVAAKAGIGEEDGNVGLGRPAPGVLHHGLVKLALGGEYPRRINHDHLCRTFHENGAKPCPGGLRLVGND